MHAIQCLNLVSALQIHSHPILTAYINTSSELILSPIFTSMQLAQFWHHPHQWDMVRNWKIINCKLYGEHKNLHQKASLNVFTVNVKKADKQEDVPATNLT